MKKIIQISLVVMFAATLVMGIFQLAPDTLIDVGWNTGVSMAPSQSLQVASCRFCGTSGPVELPYVGWNTGS